MLWNCKWSNQFDNISIEIERPRVLPDNCALVFRYVPIDLTQEFIAQEILKSIKSSVSFSKTNYYRLRKTNDIRFCVTDETENNETIKIGRLAIGHILLPINACTPGLKITYCSNCWELGHIRCQCKISPQRRKCLDPWDSNHQCSKLILCAQYHGLHSSFSLECQIVKNYRDSLREEVNNALKDGRIQQVKNNSVVVISRLGEDENPVRKKVNASTSVWPSTQGPSIDFHKQHGIEQISEILIKIKNVLEITCHTETKIDNQAIQMEIIDKTTSIKKQALIVLTDII